MSQLRLYYDVYIRFSFRLSMHLKARKYKCDLAIFVANYNFTCLHFVVCSL